MDDARISFPVYPYQLKQIATWIRECDEPAFERVFRSHPDVRIWNARTEKPPEQIDGLLLTGGTDISREFLRQPVPDLKLIEDPDPARDAWEFAILPRSLQKRLPLFAICRGLQVLNVTLGGTLHLDIPGHDKFKFHNVQPLRYVNGAPLRIPRVNSSHHQAIDQPGAGLEIEAWCADDDVIEQARLRDYPFGLGVQYHPERDPLYDPLFDAFVHHVQQAGL
ncbi:MAG: gamma-glutamyl-gamma-aminobutyrate hydrolase family protein [Methylacidiphilales bacterium]|nr:gamma-glutamyl-gamma-aminobutyrate hydrolase family protein [Candidatus Methylacidiphilales bacterium]